MRKTATITIETEGRDKGKTFLLTEKSAYDSERWALQALCALANTGIEIPPDISNRGMAGLVSVGLDAISRLPFHAAEPLVSELMDCVKAIPDANKPGTSRPLVEEDIEEVSTLIQLKKEVIELHTGFFSAANRLTSESAKPQGTPA